MKYFKLLLIGICLTLVSQSVYAAWMFNPYTRKQDYYEASESFSWSGLAELATTTGLDAKYLLWDDGGTSKVMTGENFADWVLTFAQGVDDTEWDTIAEIESATSANVITSDEVNSVAALNTLTGATILYSGGALGTPSGGTLTNCTFPNLTVNTTGTAGGLSGTPNITVGTVSAGAGGALIDATGNLTSKSLTTAASATPTYTVNDIDAPGTDKEIARLVGAYVDGADGAENGKYDLNVHEAGTTTTYIELDGKVVDVEVKKPLLCESTLTGNGAVTLGDGGDDVKIKLQKNTSDGTWNGITMNLTAHENVAFGQLVFINSDGEAALADADAAATMPAVAIVVVAANANNTCTVLTHGVVSETDWAFTAGNRLYVSESGGSIEATLSNISDTNDVVQIIGVALGGDTILFNPSLAEVVLE